MLQRSATVFPGRYQTVVRFFRFIGAVAATMLSCTPATAWAAPKVLVRLAPADRQQYCTAPAKTMLVVVADGEKELAKAEYCAREGRMAAQLFTDHRGKTYVVARTGDDTGDESRADAEYVRVLNLDHERDAKTGRDVFELGDFASVALPPAAGSHSEEATYHVANTKAGGLELIVEYPARKPAWNELPPIKQVVVHLGP